MVVSCVRQAHQQELVLLRSYKMYKLFKSQVTNQLTAIVKTDGENVLVIPMDKANTDYQEYLAWIAEGNTPEEAE